MSGIDLSAGLVSKPAPAPAPAQPNSSGDIDLSAGLVPQDGASQPPSPETPISEGDKGVGAGVDRGVSGLLGLPANIWHAIVAEPATDEEKQVQALSGRGGLAIHRLIAEPMNREHAIADAYQKIADSQKQKAEEFGSPGTTGHPLWDETLGRFIDLGSKDPAQKAANDAQHMANMHRIAGLVPLIGPYADQISQHFLQGDKSGAVAELLTALALGKATEAGTKGLAKQISKVAPKTAVVAGEEVPIMAGQEKGAAPIARKVAVTPDPETKIAEQQQAGAQRGVENVASDALNNQLSKLGRDEVPAPKQLLPAGGERDALSTTYTDEGLRSKFGIPDAQPIDDLVKKGLVNRNTDGTFSVASLDAARKLGMPDMPEPFVFTIPGDVPEETIEGGSGIVRAGKTLAPKTSTAAPDGANIPSAENGQGVTHGAGGASVEELARNEKFWRIKRNGTLSYNGVSPDANLQDGDLLVGVKPDGTLRVQANRTPFSDSEALDKLGPKVSVAARAGRQLNVSPLRPSQPVEPQPASARPNYARRWQYLDSPASDAVGQNVSIRGQGTLHTADPVAAQNTLDALKTIKTPSPSVKMAVQSLSDQLQKYHAYDDAANALKNNPEAQLAHGQPRPAIPKSGRATSFADAAAQTKAAAQPTFQRLDQLSDGEFNTLQNKRDMARKAMYRATSVDDLEAAQKQFDGAQRGIYDLMQKHAGEFQPNELRNAELAWKDMLVLNKVHGYVEKAFSAPQGVASSSNLVNRTLSGKSLIGQLNAMTRDLDPADINRVLGPDGLKNLYEIARIAGDPAGELKLNSALNEVGGYVGQAIHTPTLTRNAVARMLSTSPRASSLLVTALQSGTRAKIYAPLIAAELQKATQDQQSTQDSDQIYSELTAK